MALDTNTTTQQTITPGTPLTISETGSVTSAGPAVTFVLANPGTDTLDNSGTIAPTTGRALDTSGTARGVINLSITNRAGASITGASDVMRMQRTLLGGTMTVDNAGSIVANAGRGFNVQEFSGLSAFTFTNHAGATLQSTDDAIRLTTATANAVFTGTLEIDNAGTIRTVGAGSGQAIDLNDVNPTAAGHVLITNRAGGIIESGDADAVRAADYATIRNFGTIQSKNATLTSTGNDGIDAQANVGVAIENNTGAAIIGARHGITGDAPITITNDGSITGQHGAGVNLDTPGASTTVIVNTLHGVITGTAVGISDGDAIDVDGLVDITNSGIIRAIGHSTGADAPINEALAIGGGSVVNEKTGLIYSDERAITVDNSDLGNAFGAISIVNHGTITGANGEAIHITSALDNTLFNDGTINGSVVMGDGKDTVTVAGRINGALSTGAGNDTITVTGRVIGVIDGGDGEDRIIGSVGNDTIMGGAGNDWIEGGKGNDTLSGGEGADVFYFSGLGNTGRDHILDFGSGDTIVTNVKIRDSDNNGIIEFGTNGLLDFAAGGRVQIDAEDGSAISSLHYLGEYDQNGAHYYVYGASENIPM